MLKTFLSLLKKARDYPHSRHLCLKYPFETTPHENFCELCYCYVCDLAAPCNFWTEAEAEAEMGHCHASENTGNWKKLRILRKKKS
ncbi:uncharacterized protein LOC123230039 isoform X2 [Mangifera indica]|uniref:uncharacterized protein LOC123230039 isoform X2 n=1 Tax=Mangifera indica TaxID=29780 RepID=UPI001CFBDD70|nr:uncharacterized protein LOC123230039 isoform X2 [Mangifera indica]